MAKQTDSEEVIPKKYLDKAKSLENVHGPITVLYVKSKDKDYVVYLKAPRRHQKMAIIDQYLSSKEKTQAGAMLIEACMLADESDKVLMETPEMDKVFIGMCLKAMAVIDFYDCEIKKN